jgi:hypothetical protein
MASCFSLWILLRVFSSLQETLGLIGRVKNSPTKASMCFLIRGVNEMEVGLPKPKFSSKWRNYS